MKKLFTLIAALLFAATVWAQSSSPKMSYQAVIRNAANELVTSQSGLTVQISIKEGDAVVYSETHNNVSTNQNGLVSLLIGEGTNPVGNLKDVDWTNATIETQISGVPGNGPVTATVPVTAVPYALYADTANAVNPNSEVINNVYNKINDTLNAYYDTTAINNKLDNYLTIDGLCDSIKNCPTITEIQSNISEIEGNITNITDDYLTKAGLCDSIKSCPTIKDMDNSISENKAAIEAIDGRIRTDSLEIVELYASTMESVLGKIKTDSSALAGQISTNANQIATNTGEIASIKDDYLTKAGLCDSIKSCDAIKDLNDTLDFYYTKEEINDTLSKYLTKKQINKKLKNYLTIDGLCDSIKNCPTITEIQSNISEIKGDINNLTDDYLTKAGLCDSIKSCDKIKQMDEAISTLNRTNFDTIYNKSAQDAKLHLTKDYGFKIFNWGTLPEDEAAVYIINQSGTDVTKTSALTAKDNDVNPSMTAFLIGKDPTIGQAAVVGTVNQGATPVMGALGYSNGSVAAAVMANGPIAFLNGNYATDINNGAMPATLDEQSPYTLVTETTLKGSIDAVNENITNLTNDYLTKAGLCDSIQKCPTITEIQENITKLQIDTVAKLKELIQEVSGDLSEYEIKNCDDVTACVNTALSEASSTTNNLVDSIVDGHIKLADSLATKSYVESAVSSFVTSEELNEALSNYYTSSKIDDTLENYARISQEKALTIKSLNNADSTKLLNDTTLAIPEDFTLDTNHLVKLYINGVYVGDNSDGVLVVTDNKKVHYVPAENGGYALKAGDRIKILYWVKKN